MNPQLYERYQRQIILGGFGEEGQQMLMEAKVLVIGAGGLGCPVLQYLAAAGVGTIGIADDDVVALNNLHRQVLYRVQDIGAPKAEAAGRVLGEMNPEIRIISHQVRLTTANALPVIRAYDVIVDGSDNFATRYLANDACVLLDKPLVYGAISQFEGQVAVFNQRTNNGNTPVNYRDIFPQPPGEDEVLNCAEAGVLGVLPGIIGSMMANETIKLITGMGESLAERLLTYNALNNQVYLLNLSPAEETRTLIPRDEAAFLKTDYVWLCSSSVPEMELDHSQFASLLKEGSLQVIDVREPHELPVITEFAVINIPLSQVADQREQVQGDTVVTICQSGKRSLQAARILTGIFGDTKKVYSLRGGILQWNNKK